MKPKVSVLTTVYNRENYLQKCIESVKAERFQDYEHIIVDDGSADNSQAIAAELAESDARIQFHINPSNLGDYPNRNRAASLASGEYLKYLDADDCHGRWALEVMVDAMDLFPKAGWGLFDYDIEFHPQPIQISGEEALCRYYSESSRLFHRSPLNAMIRRSAFDAVGGFREDRMVGDFDMWHRLAKQFPVVLFPNHLLMYRHHEDQETAVHSKAPLTGIRYSQVALEHLNDKATPMAESLRAESKTRLLRQLARTILVHVRQGRWSDAKAIKQELKWSWVTIFQNAR